MNIEKEIIVSAPTRVLDFGGWTDIAASGHGKVLNIAVEPLSTVRLKERHDREVIVHLPNFGLEYRLEDGIDHPIIDECIRYFRERINFNADIYVDSPAPPGASIGTSASVLIALVGTLNERCNTKLGPTEIISLAHHVETQLAGREAGVQDYVPAVFGGCNLITIGPFPNFEIEKIDEDRFLNEVIDTSVTLHIGGSHDSSELHKQVIQSIKTEKAQKAMHDLRGLAEKAGESIRKNDTTSLASVANESTTLQSLLHSELVSKEFSRLIQIAEENKALGCKVNGAGGYGGTVTIIFEKHQHAMTFLEAPKSPDVSLIDSKYSIDGMKVKSK